MNALEKLRQVTDEIRALKNPLRLVDDWGLAGRLAQRLGGDAKEVAAVVKAKDIDGLDAIVRRLEGVPGKTTAPVAGTPEAVAAPGSIPPQADIPGDAPEFSAEDKAAALRAFKKRLKLARLGEESKLGGRLLTGGRKSQIDAILPPEQFPRSMWTTLARDGRLRDTGQGFYALPESPARDA